MRQSLLPASFRRTSVDHPMNPRWCSCGLPANSWTLQRSTWQVPTSFAWQASGLLGSVLAEPPTTVRTSVELSNSQRDHELDSGATPAACLSFIVVNPAHQNKTSIETTNPKQLTKLSDMSLVPRRFVRFFGASSSRAAYCPIGQLTPQLRYPWHNTRSSWPDARVHGPKPSVDTSTDPPARRPIFWHVPPAQHDFPALIVSSWSRHPASLKTQIKS